MSDSAYKPGKHGPIRFDSKETEDPKYSERESFFFIDDEEYTILKNPSPRMGMRFLELARTRGEVGAIAHMFDEITAPGTLGKLSKVKSLNEDHVQMLMGVVADKLTGAAQVVAGN